MTNYGHIIHSLYNKRMQPYIPLVSEYTTHMAYQLYKRLHFFCPTAPLNPVAIILLSLTAIAPNLAVVRKQDDLVASFSANSIHFIELIIAILSNNYGYSNYSNCFNLNSQGLLRGRYLVWCCPGKMKPEIKERLLLQTEYVCIRLFQICPK